MLIGGGVGIALAETGPPGPDANGVFHGCVESNGNLHLVTAGTACPKGQLAISWNQVGPQGPAGPTGPQGAPGVAGPAGPQGTPGMQWQGQWNGSTVYQPGDAVYDNGTAYITPRQTSVAEPPAAPWQILAAQGGAGPAGPPGPQGPAGQAGPAGPPGSGGLSSYDKETILLTVDAGTSKSEDVQCPVGLVPIGGGGHIGNIYGGWGSSTVFVSESDVDDSGTGWQTTFTNNSSAPYEFRADAICASTS